MPDAHLPPDTGLGADLVDYFAETTATDLPISVQRMSSATLAARRSRRSVRLARPGMALAGAALVVVFGLAMVRAHPGDSVTSSPALQAGSGSEVPAAPFTAVTGAPDASLIAFPGVDVAEVRAALHVSLLSPVGHGDATLSAAQAVADATGDSGQGARGVAAALSFVEDATRPGVGLCWVVEVAVPAGGGSDDPRLHGVNGDALLLVDAGSGAVVDVLHGAGIP